MQLEALIAKLMVLLTYHPGSTRVLINHSDAAQPYFIPAEDGCPGYVSLESE